MLSARTPNDPAEDQMTSSSYDHPTVRIVVERGAKPGESTADVGESHDLSSLCMAKVDGYPGYGASAENVNEAVGMALQKMYPLMLSRSVRRFLWSRHPPSDRPLSPELNEAYLALLRQRQFAPVGAAAIANQIPGVEVKLPPEPPSPDL